MRVRFAVAGAAVLAVLRVVAAGEAPGAAGEYGVDPFHSSVTFKVRHLGVSDVRGRFDEMSGSYSFDPANPAASSVSIEVQAASVDTNAPKRDDHLRKEDFFDAAKIPLITFRSKTVKAGAAADAYEAEGDLTLHGVTKTVAVTIQKIGEGWGMKREFRTGFETTFTIKRSDYGMTFMPDAVGDEIAITVSLEGVRK